MKRARINAVFVGCDGLPPRRYRQPDRHLRRGCPRQILQYPVLVFCPSSTIDFSCRTGADIKIELRQPEEIKEKFFAKPIAPPEIKCYNPAFDVTDNALITAIVTEKGVCRPPYTRSLAEAFMK